MIKLSKQLSIIFRKHFDKVYILAWYGGLIRGASGRDEAIEKIRMRYGRYITRNQYMYDDKSLVKGIKKFETGTKEFLKDLEALSHSDFDLLKQINPKEGLSRPIKTIGGKEVELSKEV